MNYKEAIQFLHQEAGRGIQLGLERMRDFLNELGNPQEACNIIHVAGTNGKGSTSSFVASMLAEHNLKVGRYSSPAVFEYEEMISIETKDKKEYLSKEMLVMLVEKMQEVATRWRQQERELPTTFEMETALAFLAFAEWRCDLVVLEVGLGGKEDATNVIAKPFVSVLTSISLDHQKLLGDSIRQIALQKAGIIKKNGIVVTDRQEFEAKHVIEQYAREKKAMVYERAQAQIISMSPEGTEFTYHGQHYQIGLLGEHQVANACLALEAVEHLPQPFVPGTEEKQRGLKRTIWPGRLEIIGKKPWMIIDGAHNPDGARQLARTIGQLFPKENIVGIMGVFRDKNYQEMISATKEIFSEVIAVPAEGERALPEECLQESWLEEGVKNVHTAPNVNVAIAEYKKRISPEDVIVIFGSLSFLKEIQIGTTGNS